MNFIEHVEQKKKEARKKNIKQVREEINLSWVKEKIVNHVKAFDGLFTYEDIYNGILTNDIIASKFCKDPSKQNISEKLAAEVLGLKKLPASGKNCIRFSDTGDIVNTANPNHHSKSADFLFQGYYATQKYTNEEGGAQDNQRNDVIDFLKRGSLKHKVAAIVDGAYWEKYRPIIQEEFKDNPNVLITSITEITEKNKEMETYGRHR